ncbi:protein gone early [Anopheles coustani]|uniref:protein gone early n=1 Tax=Anopheles coustani TaxID=139045 RepID=UPI00265A92F9|nr:protein gone early [Anopheles coustani]
MAESAARAGATASGGSGGGGGGRAGRFTMVDGLAQPAAGSNHPHTPEEARLLQEKGSASEGGGGGEGTGSTAVFVGDTGNGSNGGATGGLLDDAENGNLTRNDALAVSVIDTADGGGGGGANGSSYKPIKNRRKNFPRGMYERLLKLFDVSKKSERPFLLLIVICLVLLLIIVVLAICWPRIPAYLRKEVCVEAECLEASKQILTWAKPSVATCLAPYEWACGRFEERFQAHAFRDTNKGEWSPRAHEAYQRTTEAYEFISKLPTAAMSYSTQLMIHKLHTGCTRLETVSNSEAYSALRRIFRDLGGWNMIDVEMMRNWDLRDYLHLVQPKYGAAPFFKLGIDTRNQPPYDYMITVTEGDLGLPSKEFYTLAEKHPIIRAYHTFLTDTLAHMISTSTEIAQDYAKTIYNYEKRIALDVMGVVLNESGNFSRPQIRTMHQLVNDAPSLPILETAQALFKSKKITEHTEVMVSSPAALKAISQIITTSDKEVLNKFFMWSVIRHFVPFMSRKFRVSLHQFEQVLYGAVEREPMWHFCTNVVQQWMPYGLEALRENPALIVHDQRSSSELSDYHHHHPSAGVADPAAGTSTLHDPISYDDELVKLIFYHLREEYRQAVVGAHWLSEPLTHFLTNKLSTLRLQIGIPRELLQTERTLNEYYRQLVLDGLLFVDSVVNQWGFTKTQMTRMLDNQTEPERILAEMFPPRSAADHLQLQTRQRRNHLHYQTPLADTPVKYSIALNMVIISRQRIQEPFFHHHYPISVNFARLGAEIAQVLQSAIHTLTEQYWNVETSGRGGTVRHDNVFNGEAQKCMARTLLHTPNGGRISNATRLNLYLELSAVNVLTQAFGTLLDKIDRNERIYESDISEKTTYEMLGLSQHRRLPGLQPYDERQLFTLAYFQRHCSVGYNSHRLTKLLTQNDIPEIEKFDLLWQQITPLGAVFECKPGGSGGGGPAAGSGACSNVL